MLTMRSYSPEFEPSFALQFGCALSQYADRLGPELADFGWRRRLDEGDGLFRAHRNFGAENEAEFQNEAGQQVLRGKQSVFHCVGQSSFLGESARMWGRGLWGETLNRQL